MQFLANLSIRTRILGGVFLALTVMAGAVAFGALQLWLAGERFHAYEDQSHDALTASEINADMAKVLLNAREYLAARSADDLKATREYLRQVKEEVARGEKGFHTPEGVQLIAKIIGSVNTFEQGLERLVKLMEQRDKIVGEVLDVVGPEVRKGLTAFTEAAAKDKDFELASHAGQVQEDLLTARLYVAKFLLSNSKDDGDWAETELADTAKHFEAVAGSVQNPARGRAFATIRPLLAQYRQGFADLRKTVEERNAVRTEALDKVGAGISEWAAQLKASAVASERQLSEESTAKT